MFQFSRNLKVKTNQVYPRENELRIKIMFQSRKSRLSGQVFALRRPQLLYKLVDDCLKTFSQGALYVNSADVSRQHIRVLQPNEEMARCRNFKVKNALQQSRKLFTKAGLVLQAPSVEAGILHVTHYIVTVQELCELIQKQMPRGLTLGLHGKCM